jgi:hypothetical protein
MEIEKIEKMGKNELENFKMNLFNSKIFMNDDRFKVILSCVEKREIELNKNNVGLNADCGDTSDMSGDYEM